MLSSTKNGEKSLVLHTLSRSWGRRSFICSLSKNCSTALYQPLNILNAEITENPRSDLWRAQGISASFPLGGIRGNLYKNSMTLFMSEVLFRTIREGQGDEGLYDWCRKSILTLDGMDSDFSNYHLRFLLEFAGALGFDPGTEDIAPFAGKHLSSIKSLMTESLPESMLLPLNGESRNEIAEILLKYLGHHTESNINVRSLGVMRELYSQI